MEYDEAVERIKAFFDKQDVDTTTAYFVCLKLMEEYKDMILLGEEEGEDEDDFSDFDQGDEEDAEEEPEEDADDEDFEEETPKSKKSRRERDDDEDSDEEQDEEEDIPLVKSPKKPAIKPIVKKPMVVRKKTQEEVDRGEF